MRLLWRVLGGFLSTFGYVLIFVAGMQAGQWLGYGKGARDIARLVTEMRQGAYETPEPWEHGNI